MIINNRVALSTSRAREQALDIIEAGIESVLPENIMRSAVSFDEDADILTVQRDEYDVSRGRIFVIGGGKASGAMAGILEEIIGADRVTTGIVSVKADAGRFPTERIKVVGAGHPVPDRRGISAVSEMKLLKAAFSMGEDDLVICLISGGGSALMPGPADGLSLEDKQALTGMLLGSGADIYEINTVRKHLSEVKGGRLGLYFSPVPVVSLILSDVVGNDLSVVASGPTYPDSSTFRDAWAVLEKYGLLSTAPEAAVDLLERGVAGVTAETPDTLPNCHNYIIGDNSLALRAMSVRAVEEGFRPLTITAEQTGETTEAARKRAEEIISGKYAGHTALLLGGETAPRLPEQPGRGGRNQHYAALTMQAFEKFPGEWLVISVGTDGSDYLSEVAGAITDRSSLESARAKGLDIDSYLRRYDSFTLLSEIGGSLVETGDTGTNVGDICLYLIPEK